MSNFNIRIFDSNGERTKITFTGDVIEHREVHGTDIQELFSVQYCNRIVVFSDEPDNTYGYRANVMGVYPSTITSGTGLCPALFNNTVSDDTRIALATGKYLYAVENPDFNMLFAVTTAAKNEAGHLKISASGSITTGDYKVALKQSCISHNLFMSIPIIDNLTYPSNDSYAVIQIDNQSGKRINIYSIRED